MNCRFPRLLQVSRRNCAWCIVHFILPCSVLLLTACEKEIDIDYHDMEPMYVIEGSVSNLNSSVTVTMTQPVKGGAETDTAIADATVVVTADDGQRDTLTYRGNGLYMSRQKGKAGSTYRLDVTTGGNHFTSTSVMQKQPTLNSMRFVWKKVFGQRVLLADLKLQDIADEANYYYLHFFRNGVPYRSAVLRDRSNPGGELQQLFSLCMEDDLNSGDPNAKETLWENDVLTLDIRTIDRRAYDYLYSLLSMNSNNTNPIDNFEGGCLGYFSAFHQISYNYTFHASDAEEE